MIVRRRCPYTGVVNFYSDAEPYLPMGSIAVCGSLASDRTYTWRSYTDDTGSRGGASPDFALAERRLMQRLTPLDSGSRVVAGE